MRTIQIRGVILPGLYDGDWADDYIQRGVFTPESRVRKQLAEAAEGKEDVEIYLNSPGGSVFAGSEMINAMQEYIRSGAGELTIKVGAMAASMAAAILALVPRATASAYRNSKIMFHSATSCVCAGPELMEDVAKLLHDINADVLSVLVKRDESRADEFATWFAEGREGWITAQEAQELGLIDTIIGQDDKTVAGVSRETAAALAAHDLDLAAFAVDDEEPGGETVPAAELAAMQGKYELAEGKYAEMLRRFEQSEARLKGLQAAKDSEISSLKKDFDATAESLASVNAELSTLKQEHQKIIESLATAEAAVSTLTAEKTELAATLDRTAEQLEASEAARAKLTGGVLAPGDSFGSWEEAKARLGYARARREHEDLYQEFMLAARKQG